MQWMWGLAWVRVRFTTMFHHGEHRGRRKKVKNSVLSVIKNKMSEFLSRKKFLAEMKGVKTNYVLLGCCEL